jgi:hypothetical protein
MSRQGLLLLASRLARRFGMGLVSRLPLEPVRRPWFILGCARSGTTILGRTLARHRGVTYLNEPRELWASCYPFTDIWSHDAGERGGRLVLGAGAATVIRARRLGRLFRREARRQGGVRLVEKLPANSFRVPFLRANFPESRVVVIHRNGREVARSIGAQADQGRWWGEGEFRWRQLKALAARLRPGLEPEGMCPDNYHRGLLEWTLCNLELEAGLQRHYPGRVCRVSYRELVGRPGATLARVIQFLELEPDPGLEAFAERAVSRRSRPEAGSRLSGRELAIGGELLLRHRRD